MIELTAFADADTDGSAVWALTASSSGAAEAGTPPPISLHAIAAKCAHRTRPAPITGTASALTS